MVEWTSWLDRSFILSYSCRNELSCEVILEEFPNFFPLLLTWDFVDIMLWPSTLDCSSDLLGDCETSIFFLFFKNPGMKLFTDLCSSFELLFRFVLLFDELLLYLRYSVAPWYCSFERFAFFFFEFSQFLLLLLLQIFPSYLSHSVCQRRIPCR